MKRSFFVRFRPCIDIHNGRVKQIVGASLRDEGDQAEDNFVSGKDSCFYSDLYFERGLSGGHIILLNGRGSSYYEATKEAALAAVRRHPGFWQVGGGVNADNAKEYIDAGASHVIVTSYVFYDGRINYERLEKMTDIVGSEHLVLDLSCKKKEGCSGVYVVTDRWQKFTEERLSEELLERLSDHCDEFLVHAADVEGKRNGPSEEVLEILSGYDRTPVTYAGGIASISDIERIRDTGKGRVDFTVGSALDIFGGNLSLDEVCSL